jgi:hypothetical protein
VPHTFSQSDVNEIIVLHPNAASRRRQEGMGRVERRRQEGMGGDERIEPRGGEGCRDERR